MTVDVKKLNKAIDELEEKGIFQRSSITSATEAFEYHQTVDELLGYVLRSVFSRIRSVDTRRLSLSFPISNLEGEDVVTGSFGNISTHSYNPGIQYTSGKQGKFILKTLTDILEATGYEVEITTDVKVDAIDSFATVTLSEAVKVLKVSFASPKDNQLETNVTSKQSTIFDDWDEE